MFSLYFQILNGDSKPQFVEKLKIINSNDPYTLPKELSSKLEDFPGYGYLVYECTAYTSENLKSYKSLQSYTQFLNMAGYMIFMQKFFKYAPSNWKSKS